MAHHSEVGLSDIERAAIQILIDRELTAAVSKTNEELKAMGLADIKDRLSHIPGIDGLTVTPGIAGSELYHLGDKTVEVPAGNAGVRNRIPYLADGFANTQPLPTLEALTRVDDAVASIQTPRTENGQMATIAEQLKAARAKLAEARQGAADAITESDHAHSVVLGEVNKVLKEASDLRAEVAELTNGGPA